MTKLLLFLFCGVVVAEVIETKDFTGVILPGTEAPSRAQVMDAEARLKKYFADGFKPKTPIEFEGHSFPDLKAFKAHYAGKKHKTAEDWLSSVAHEEKRYKEVALKWPRYKRQYIGLREKERSYIVIHFFIGDFPQWKTDVVDVNDGGTDFLEVKYDPAAKKAAEVHIHGEA